MRIRYGSLLVLCAAMLLQSCTRPVTAPRPELPAEPVARFEATRWSRIDGWIADDLLPAWQAFVAGCGALHAHADWERVCELASRQAVLSGQQARRFFETQFDPYRIAYRDAQGRVNDTGLVTGYYEPVLRGSRTPSPTHTVPLYAVPDDLLVIELGELYPMLEGERVRGRLQGRRVVPYFDRSSLDAAASVRGKELVWVDSAVDAFFLQIQGSGRVQLPGGEMLRLAYADVNGHPYRAIGRYLVERGELTLEEATAPGIRAWLQTHPERLAEVLNSNPSVVFFREENMLDPQLGPRGALGVPLTAGRSLAIDRRHLPLGVPIFLATTHPESTAPLTRLVMSQDTGGAIRGVLRADLFFGLGPAAGEQAGRMRQSGRMWLLWPKGRLPPQPDLPSQ